jgi:arginase
VRRARARPRLLVIGYALEMARVALLGLPWDEHSSFQRGAAGAPPLIRAAMRSPSSNLSTESGLDLGWEARFSDAGDVEIPEGAGALAAIEGVIGALASSGARVMALGGDHAITYPVLRAQAAAYPGLTIVHFDAHPDLYDEFEGDRLSHASPFARIMEEKLAARLVQVGIRTLNAPQRAQIARFGVELVEMKDFRPDLLIRAAGPVYVSVDLDGLDPAYAPGVSHPEPGGLSTRDVLGVLQRLEGQLIGADVVELNPQRDPDGTTARVAAKITKELVARMLAD